MKCKLALMSCCVVLAVLVVHGWSSPSNATATLGFASFGMICVLLSCLGTNAGQAQNYTPTKSSHTAANHDAKVISFPATAMRDTDSRVSSVTNSFTVDLEDYFHTEVAARKINISEWDSMPARIPATVPRLLDLLERHNVRATFFVLGWVARKHPALVKEVARRGHEIGCHSYNHRPVFRLTREEFRADTLAAKTELENLTGQRVLGYRAPSFSIVPGVEWAFEELAEMGFEYDSSINPIHHKFYGNPTAPRFAHLVAQNQLLEIPVATRRIGGKNLPVSGGAYLRLLPFSYIMSGLKHINTNERQPFTIYMHPWEIDSHQPPLELGWMSDMRQTSKTLTMESKLEMLVRAFNFAPMAQVYATPLKGTATTVQLATAFAS